MARKKEKIDASVVDDVISSLKSTKVSSVEDLLESEIFEEEIVDGEVQPSKKKVKVPANVYDGVMQGLYEELDELANLRDSVRNDPSVNASILTTISDKITKVNELIANLAMKKTSFVEEDHLLNLFINVVSKALLQRIYKIGRFYLSKVSLIAFLNDVSSSLDEFDTEVTSLIGNRKKLSVDIVAEIEKRGLSFDRLERDRESMMARTTSFDFEVAPELDAELEEQEKIDMRLSEKD